MSSYYGAEKRLQQLKMTAVHELYMVSFIIFFITTTLAMVFSTWALDEIVIALVINFFETLLMLAIMFYSKRKIHNLNNRYLVYLSIACVHTFFVVYMTRSIYLLSGLLFMVALCILVFFTFSRKHLSFFLIINLILITIEAYRIVGQELILSHGYTFAIVGSFILIAYILMRGVKFIEDYEGILEEQTVESEARRVEAVSLNVALRGANERTQEQYDQISRLHEGLVASYDEMDAIVAATEDGFININIGTHKVNSTDKALDMINRSKVVCNGEKAPEFFESMTYGKQEALDAWQIIRETEAEYRSVEVGYDDEIKHKDFRLTLLNYTDTTTEQRHIVCVIKDITTERTQERIIRKKANRSEVTGLLNRFGFVKAVNSAINEGKRNFYVAMFDIDSFKQLNDAFGYDVGDNILRQVATKLSVLDENISLVSNIEGDSFAFLVDEQMNAQDLTYTIIDGVTHISVSGTEITLSISLGIATMTEDAIADDLLRKAEFAMFESKEEEGNEFSLYDEEANQENAKRFRMLTSLKEALDAGELFMVFQPKVDTKEDRIIGFEGLVRWISAEYGFVPPDYFIELAEQSGLIVELGDYIINECVRFSSEVNGDGGNYRVTINISPKQLISDHFVDKFSSALERYGVDVSHVGIEVTETAYMDQMETATKVLVELRALGIKIFLDDFGTGYSSLSYLLELPIDVIKIDKSFIDHIHLEESSQRLLVGIMGITNELGLESVAEGVEYVEQLEILQEIGCKVVQGYYYYKPMKVEEIHELIKA